MRTDNRDQAVQVLFTCLQRRGYSRSFLRGIRKDTYAYVQMGEAVEAGRVRVGPLIRFISRYSTSAVAAHRLVKRNFKENLLLTGQLGQCRVVSVYCRNPNFKDLLVRAALPQKGVGRSPVP